MNHPPERPLSEENPLAETPENDSDPEVSRLLFPDEDELRREFRLAGRVFVRIEVQAGDPHSGEPPRYVYASTQDVSSNGASLSTPLSLPLGALIAVRIDIEGEDLSFDMTSEVMWCREPASGESGYRVGLQFLESDDTGIIDWKEAVAGWLSREDAD